MLSSEVYDLGQTYLSAGTPGYGVSLHKAALASQVLGIDVGTEGVACTEPKHYSCELLTKEKFIAFHNAYTRGTSQVLVGRGIEYVADLTMSVGAQGEPFGLEGSKMRGIKAGNGRTVTEVLAHSVATKFGQFAQNSNIVIRAEAGLAVGLCDYELMGLVAAVGVASSYITIPGNPLADAGRMREYVEQSPLGAKHIDRLPLGIDLVTLLIFLSSSGWYRRQGYSNYTEQDIINLPAKLRHRDPIMQKRRLTFYQALGRVPDDYEKHISTESLLGLLDISFNFPDYLTHAVLGSVANAVMQPSKTVWRNSIKVHSGSKTRV